MFGFLIGAALIMQIGEGKIPIVKGKPKTWKGVIKKVEEPEIKLKIKPHLENIIVKNGIKANWITVFWDTFMASGNFGPNGEDTLWNAYDGNNDGHYWVMGTTSDLSSYEPPNHGAGYAYYSDDDAGSGSPNAWEWLYTRYGYFIGSNPDSVKLVFSWGYRTYTGDDTLWAAVSVLRSNQTWTPWYVVWGVTGPSHSAGNGFATIDITWVKDTGSYVAIAYIYKDHGGWNWAVGVDNCTLKIYDETPPTTPTLLNPPNGTISNNTSVNFIWTHSTDNYALSHYVINIDGNNFANNDTTYSTTLSEGNHTWKVKAVDYANNESNWTSTWSITIDITPPSSPTLIVPPNNSFTNNQNVTFVWHKAGDNLSGIDYYEININGNTYQTSDTTYSTTLPEGIYTWKVRAIDKAGNTGNWSETWNFEVDVTPPSSPTLIAPQNNSFTNNQNVTFIWHKANDNLSGIDYYEININGNTYQTSDTTYSTTLPEGIYTWKVRAIDKAGNTGNWSETWNFEIDLTAPSTPNPITPVDTFLASTNVYFEWTQSTFSAKKIKNEKPAPVNYILQISTDSTFSSIILEDTLQTNNTTTTLSDGIYYWRVKAYDDAGNSSNWSQTTWFGVDITPPSSPILIAPANGDTLGNVDVTFIWHQSQDNLTGVAYYIIEVDGNQYTTPDTTYNLTLSEGTHTWKVKAIDSLGNESEWSEEWSFTILPSTISEKEIPEKLFVKFSTVCFENLKIIVGLPQNEKVKIKVFSINGRIVYTFENTLSKGTKEFRIKLNKGLYFLKIEIGNKIWKGNIIIIK